ncbi:TonB-dependent receptor plug domain-containing protein, partial [Burkholderia pseudomultivorans]
MTIFQLRAPRASRNAAAPRLPRVLKLTVPALAASVMTATVAAAETARAAAMPPDEAGTLLPPVEVVASPLTTPLVVVTDPKTPRQPLPASDGADYLKTIPGFTSIRSGGTNGDPVLRGMFGSRLNILANGMPTLGACPNRMDAPTSYIA